MPTIYHLAQKENWEAAEQSGLYAGGLTDKRDGFIHFSSDAEIETSAALYCQGMTDMGSFIALYGITESVLLIRRALAGEDLGKG